MKLQIKNALENPGQSFHVELAERADTWDDPIDYAFSAPVTLEADYLFNGASIEISGQIHTSLLVSCAKCAGEMEYPVDLEISSVFCKTPEEEGAEYGYVGEELLLDKMILDEISLELPVRFLCSESCKGLCPVCGKNRNLEDCGCDAKEGRVSPFDQLKGLFD